MFGKHKYVNIIELRNKDQAVLVAAKEGYGTVNRYWDFDSMGPLLLTVANKRSKWQAVKRSMEYSKMGLFNIVQQVE